MFFPARALFLCLGFFLLFFVPVANAITWNVDFATVTANDTVYWNGHPFSYLNATYYNRSDVDGLISNADNSSWNESYADTLYADISVVSYWYNDSGTIRSVGNENYYVNSNFSVDHLDIRSNSSIKFIVGNENVTMGSQSFTISNKTRSGVTLSGDLGISTNRSGSLVGGVVNTNNDPNSSSAFGTNNVFFHSMSIAKYSATHSDPSVGYLFNWVGNQRIINSNSNSSVTSISFYDSVERDTIASATELTNQTHVIEVHNKNWADPFLTNFNYNVNMSGNLHVDGNFIGNGSQLFDVNETDTFQSITDRNSTTTNNISIGEEVAFSNGESLDNSVDGWIRVNGNLSATGHIFTAMSIFAYDIGSTGSYISNLFATNITAENISASLVSAALVLATTIVSDTINSTDAFFTNLYATNTYTDFLQVEGDINQTGGNATINMIYGGLSNYSSAGWTFDIASSSIYYNMTNLSITKLNGFGFNDNTQENGGSQLVVQIPGTYELSGKINFKDGANNLYGGGIAINGIINRYFYDRSAIGTANTYGNILITPQVVELEAGDTINLQLEDEAIPANDAVIHNLALYAKRVGE